MTLDLGAGPMEVMSNVPIVYGQWHELMIDRRGYYVTVVVRSEEGQVATAPRHFVENHVADRHLVDANISLEFLSIHLMSLIFAEYHNSVLNSDCRCAMW